MTSELDRMMGDPMKQIDELLAGVGLLRKAEHQQPSPEYTEALELLEPHGEYMTASDGDDVLVITVPRAADLIADNYVRRES